MIHIQAVYPNAADATSLYRGAGPFSHMIEAWDLPIQMHHPKDSHQWPVMAHASVVFLQRPHSQEHVSIAQKARRLGRPVWIDYDDDLFCVPTDNPVYGLYSREETRKNIAKLCAMADVVTVSTKRLVKVYKELSDRVTHVPNALNEILFGYRSEQHLMKEPLIMWRGSETHARDVSTATIEVEKVYRSEVAKNWKWFFQGYNPWFLTDTMTEKNVVTGEGVNPDEYHEIIQQLKPVLTWVPLHNSPFNKAKSNIAWIETVWAGGLCIGPDWEEWRHPGCFNYENPEHLARIIKEQMERYRDPTGHREMVEENRKAWDYVQQHYSLRFVNIKRKKILSELLENSPWCQYDEEKKARTLQHLRRVT